MSQNASQSASAPQSTPPRSIETIVAIAVGNTRTRVGVLKGGECLKAQSLSTDEFGDISAYTAELVEEFRADEDRDPVIIMSTVSEKDADAIERAITREYEWKPYRFGRDLTIPIRHALTESGQKTVGQDRLLCAIGAFGVVRQACIVIDMGTGITADFVDGEGVFHGGAIMPGVAMMLESMHAKTAHLPLLNYRTLDPGSNDPGRQTDDAMILGVTACVRGGIRYLAERYAEFYEGYPQIIATGGDMGVLEDDELIESFVPDLQLHGIRAAYAMVLEAVDESIDEDVDSES